VATYAGRITFSFRVGAADDVRRHRRARQMDMFMVTDASSEIIADNFLAGNYRLDFKGRKKEGEVARK